MTLGDLGGVGIFDHARVRTSNANPSSSIFPSSTILPPHTNTVPHEWLSSGLGTTVAESAGCCGARSLNTVSLGLGSSDDAAACRARCEEYGAPGAGSRWFHALATVSKTHTLPFSSATPSPPKM